MGKTKKENAFRAGLGAGLALTLSVFALIGLLELIAGFLNRSRWKEVMAPRANEILFERRSRQLSQPNLVKLKKPVFAEGVGAAGGGLEVFAEKYCCKQRNWAPIPRTGRFRESNFRTESRQPIFDVHYTFDENGYRVTPTPENFRIQHAIFLGCSFLFGEGVENQETLPAVFQSLSHKYRSYNFAFPGYAPNDLLARAQVESSAIVRESEGVIFYFFINEHFDRVAGTMSWIAKAGPHPYFTKEREGPIEHRGNFSAGRPMLNRVLLLLSRSEIIRFFHLDFPPSLSPERVNFFGDLVEELRKTYLEKYPRSRFFVVIHPGQEWGTKLIPELEKHGILYFDYSAVDVSRYVRPAYFDRNFHPTKEYYRFLAEQLSDDLERLDR